MKLTEGSAEHLQPNSACLPPQHPENSPITGCLEENRHFPQPSVLQSLYDVISSAGCFYKILPLRLSFLFPQRLNGPSHQLLEPRSSLCPALSFPALTAQSLPLPLTDCPFTHMQLGEKTDTVSQRAGSAWGL